MENIYSNIISRLKEFQERNHVNGYAIGISGGKDSTIVAKLLVDAIGKDKVLGVLIPNGHQDDIFDSFRICETLNIKYELVNIFEPYTNICGELEYYEDYSNILTGPIIKRDKFNISPKCKTNILPRLRMTVLYAAAQSLGYLVAGTGNKSERFVGWFTKWGDGACDINPIAHLTCSQVIELGDYLGLPYDLVHKTPADGLTGKSDEDNLGFTYKELDTLIKKFEESDGYLLPSNDVEKRILEMHYNSFHKFKPVTFE